MLVTGASFALSSYSPALLAGAIVGLAINWFGDSLDGTVARVRNCQRPRYGFYVDHVLDTIGILFLLARARRCRATCRRSSRSGCWPPTTW